MSDAATSGTTLPLAKQLTIGILSDLHVFDRCGPDEKSEPSHLCTLAPQDAPTQHPICGLQDLIAQHTLKADLLLCPGDLGDKARPDCIAYGWNAIHQIAASLGTSDVVGTVGNHDVDSRYKFSDHDPKGFLQSLKPPFPLPTANDNDMFWSRNFAVVERDAYRLVCLNSSAFHGGKEGEHLRGRVSDRTLDALCAFLNTAAAKPVNILLCHHHPHKHSEANLGEYDEMLGGQLLLQRLGSGRYGEWLIVHGHKHHPKLSYAAGTSSAPIIFSAGSLCAKLYAELGSLCRNQFYIVRLPYTQFDQYGLVGTLEAWDWITGLGWQRARPVGSGLPGYGGFGFRGNLQPLARRITPIVKASPTDWYDLVRTVPELEFLLPEDRVALFDRLRTEESVEVLFDPEGRPRQLGVAT
jgi:3',5'-cyclic AMP phosphodiesterase CpdA